MKKTITILLTLCICFSFCACGNTDSNGNNVNNSSPKAETISLTSSNWNQYLRIEQETQNYTYKETPVLGTTFANGTAECNISVSKSVPCSFSNVAIKLEVYSPTLSWDEETIAVDLYVSADGYASKKVKFTSEQSLAGLLNEPSFIYNIISVSGEVHITS